MTSDDRLRLRWAVADLGIDQGDVLAGISELKDLRERFIAAHGAVPVGLMQAAYRRHVRGEVIVAASTIQDGLAASTDLGDVAQALVAILSATDDTDRALGVVPRDVVNAGCGDLASVISAF